MKWKLGLHRGLEGLGFPKIRGTLFGGSHNKDCNILGSILGSPCLGKLQAKSHVDCTMHRAYQNHTSTTVLSSECACSKCKKEVPPAFRTIVDGLELSLQKP